MVLTTGSNIEHLKNRYLVIVLGLRLLRNEGSAEIQNTKYRACIANRRKLPDCSVRPLTKRVSRVSSDKGLALGAMISLKCLHGTNKY